MDVVYPAGIGDSGGAGTEDWGGVGTELSVTGQTVVDTAIVWVVVDPYGQLVTVGAHFETTNVRVVYTVEVVNPCGEEVGEGVEDSVIGQIVVDTGIVFVITVTDSAGQLLIVEAQCVTVSIDVV